MANSTLEVMQAIETEAQAVLAGYEQQIQSLREKAQADLESVIQAYETETDRQVTVLADESQERLTALKSAVDITVQENDAKVRRALTDKKDNFVQQIVDKVVERYGH